MGLNPAHFTKRPGLGSSDDPNPARFKENGRAGVLSLLTQPQSLTASEARVAQLAAEARSNRQIAQELYVTPKTVELHLSNAYRKLGIRSRRELPTALAMAS
jgi:DNA-binding NarL/FixJ family response regulator